MRHEGGEQTFELAQISGELMVIPTLADTAKGYKLAERVDRVAYY
jgi:hypothetical protein